MRNDSRWKEYLVVIVHVQFPPRIQLPQWTQLRGRAASRIKAAKRIVHREVGLRGDERSLALLHHLAAQLGDDCRFASARRSLQKENIGRGERLRHRLPLASVKSCVAGFNQWGRF